MNGTKTRAKARFVLLIATPSPMQKFTGRAETLLPERPARHEVKRMNTRPIADENRDPASRRAKPAKAVHYACLETPLAACGSHEVCTLREQDIESIRIWRNAQIDVLRQTAPISAPEQQRYFDEVVRPTFRERRPRMILLSLLRDGVCVGYCGLTNLDWLAGRGEVSFLLDPMRVRDTRIYEEDMGSALELLSRVAFERVGLNRLFAETFDIRPHHVAILESHGFRLEGRMREHATVRGQRVDSLLHGLLAREWRNETQASAD